MEAQYAGMRASLIAEKSSFERGRVERARTALESAREAIEERRDQGRDTSMWEGRLADARRDLATYEEELAQVIATAERFDMITASVRTKKGADRTATGRPGELVEYLTPIEVKDLTLKAPNGSLFSHNITVSFEHDDGVRLFVTSKNAQWARAALSEIDEAIERKVPRWRWIRSAWVLIPACYIATVLLALGILQAFPSLGKYWVALLGLIVVIGIVPNVAFALTRRALPAFELTAASQARGRVVVVMVGSWVVAVLLGVVTNLISP